MVTNSCVFCLHTRLRVRKTPGIPCALYIPRDTDDASLGQIMSRECKRMSLDVIARSASDEAIQTVSVDALWIASLSLAMTGVAL